MLNNYYDKRNALLIWEIFCLIALKQMVSFDSIVSPQRTYRAHRYEGHRHVSIGTMPGMRARACVRACVRACACACVCVRACVCLFLVI